MAVCGILGVILCTVEIALASGGGTNCYDGRYYIREDPASCTSFYKCDNGNPVSFNCPGGLYYNPTTHNCDWPYNVKCDVNQGQGSGQYNGNGQYNNGNGHTNNNGGQNNGNPNYNNGQYNGYPYNNGGQYSGNQGGYYDDGAGQDFNNQNQDQYYGNSYFYPGQTVDAQDPNIGPSINDPDGIFGERPRPTVDDLYSSRNHPYQDYLEPNPRLDIRK